MASITILPLRAVPKIHQLLIRTHKLTIFLTLPPSTTIAQVKEEALSALSSDVYQAHAEIDGTPVVASVDDFELCRATRENDRNPRSTGTGLIYEVLDKRRALRDYGFASWETIFFKFKSEDGELFPVTVTIPSVDDDDVGANQPPVDAMSDDSPVVRSTNKGKKRRVPSTDSESE
ncbi:hypothetical protein AX14_008530 [Amanita brunnescens Koide BX004]|nr:hypothetical protein AX14_008530 [Amanita brunnescens Koide BX004]